MTPMSLAEINTMLTAFPGVAVNVVAAYIRRVTVQLAAVHGERSGVIEHAAAVAVAAVLPVISPPFMMNLVSL